MTTSSPTSDAKRSSTASRAAAHSFQTKLSVSQHNDSYEQEADHVADIVVSQSSAVIGAGMTRSSRVQKFSDASAVSARVTPTISRLSQRKPLSRMEFQEEEEPQAKVQREMEEEEPQAKVQREMEEEEPQAKVQREMEEEEPQAKVQREMEEEEPQTKAQQGASSKPGLISDEMEAQLASSKGQGVPLPDDVRIEMERMYAADFRGVRIHTDAQAATLSKSLGAKAFTKGHDLYFNKGHYQPYSVEGRRLLAHELTHVVQQGASPQQAEVGGVQRKAESTDGMAESTGGMPAALVSDGGSAATVQRGAFDDLATGLGAAFDSATGAVVDAAGNVMEMGAEFFWDMLGRLAPSLVPLLREISSKGILTFLYDKLTDVLGGIFDRLENKGGVIGTLAATFRLFVTQASEILVALAQGECEPLFAAIRQFKKIVSQIAGDAWDAISEFFAPIGEFFSNVWQSFGAPLVDWLSGTAADVWEWIQNLGKQIWDWTQPVRNTLGAAWDWVKDQLGFGGGGEEGDGEGGLIGWVKGKASEAWESIQVKLQPVIAPMQAVVAKVQAVLPLEAIFNLRETITGWLDNVGSMTQSLEEEDGAATHQASLREEILPAVLRTIQSVRTALITAGTWVATQYGAVATTVLGFLDVLRSNTILGHVAGVLQWLSDGVTQLSSWAQETVIGVFTLVGEGLVRLSRFVEPILNALQKVLEVLGNLMGKLPDLILGPVWWLMPRCIKDPIKDFILNQILKRIPFFNQFLELGDVWAKVKATAMTILTQIFVDGNLLKALWTLFKAVLGIFNIPPQLVTNIIIKATEALGDIIKNPIGFIINILKAVKEGFVRFFSNILKHLFSGVVDWLFGHLEEAGIEIPPDFSLKSILGMLFQILGVTIEKLWKKLADKIGQDKVDKLKKVISVATGVWEWIKLAVEGGPGAIWAKLKEKLSDLWTSVLTGVVGWINQVIIVQATKWLLSLLDVSGITPTINALIAIYKAIESFFQYLKKMLEIVNTVLNGIADLAKGAISTAAGFLESALAKAVPIVIGFLANQFGLGKLGQRLGEIIGTIRGKVDAALDWLIEKALKLGQAFLKMLKRGVEAVKGGVAALVEWWKQKKMFRTKAKRVHTLMFRGKESNAELVVKSVERPLDKYIKDIFEPEAPNVPKLDKASYATVLANIERIQGEIAALRLREVKHTSGKKETRLDAPGIGKGEDIRLKLVELADELANLPDPDAQADMTMSRPRTVLKDWSTESTSKDAAGLDADSTDANSVTASPLSVNPGGFAGTAPVGTPTPLHTHVDSKRPGTYVRGHLISMHIHGPGRNENLAPITQTANKQMSSGAENKAHSLVYDENKVIHYKVDVQYERDASKGTIVKAEGFLPKRITFTLHELDLDPGVVSSAQGDPAQLEAAQKEPNNWKKKGTVHPIDPVESKPPFDTPLNVETINTITTNNLVGKYKHISRNEAFARGVVDEKGGEEGFFDDKPDFNRRMRGYDYAVYFEDSWKRTQITQLRSAITTNPDVSWADLSSAQGENVRNENTINRAFGVSQKFGIGLRQLLRSQAPLTSENIEGKVLHHNFVKERPNFIRTILPALNAVHNKLNDDLTFIQEASE